MLENLEVDAGLTYIDNEPLGRMRAVPLYLEQYRLLTSENSPLGDRDQVTWAEVGKIPLCLLTPDMQNRKTIDAVFAKVGAGVTPMLETNSIISILAHVGSGHWSSIVPRSVLESVGTPPGVIAIELVEPAVDWATGLVTLAREPQAPMGAALVAEARALAETFEKPA